MEERIISLKNFTTKKGAYMNQNMISGSYEKFRDEKKTNLGWLFATNRQLCANP